MGGKTTSSNNVPQYVEQGGKEAIARAGAIADMGYVPYIGPDVAAPSAATLAGWQNQNAASNAFGMAAPQGTGLEGLPMMSNGGVSGFSAFPGYKQALANLVSEYPGLAAYLQSLTIDPVTGDPGSRMGDFTAPASGFGGLTGLLGLGGDGDAGDYFSGGGSSGGGYTGIGDMFDGGGPGASGGAFEGGGRVSDIANAVTGRG